MLLRVWRCAWWVVPGVPTRVSRLTVERQLHIEGLFPKMRSLSSDIARRDLIAQSGYIYNILALQTSYANDQTYVVICTEKTNCHLYKVPADLGPSIKFPSLNSKNEKTFERAVCSSAGVLQEPWRRTSSPT